MLSELMVFSVIVAVVGGFALCASRQCKPRYNRSLWAEIARQSDEETANRLLYEATGIQRKKSDN